MKKTILLSLALLTSFVHAQDLLFLNSNQSLVNLNPSFAGSNGFIRNQTSIRKMIAGFDGAPQTVGNSFDMYLRPLKAGLALSISTESYGPVTNNRISFSYAQYLSFYKGNLKVIPSFQVIYNNKHTYSDWVGAIPQPATVSNFLFGGGLLVNYKNKLFVGTYFRDHYRSTIFSPEPLALLHASYSAKLSESTLLQFSGRISSQQGYNSVQLGVNSVVFKRIVTGIQYFSAIDSPVFSLGYRGDLFSVVAGYDFSGNKLREQNSGYAELHLSYNLRNKENRHPNSLLGFESW